MTFHEFENEIRDTLAKYIRDKEQTEKYTELMLGLYEEGAEVTSIIRRSIPGNFHETEIDIPHLEEELGDIIWYISHITMQLPETDLEEIANSNLKKIDINYRENYNSRELTIKGYQQAIINSYRNTLPKIQAERARFFAMGLIKEVGKISELFGEHRIDDTKLDIPKVKEKLGDCLWYTTAISENYGLDLEMIARKNIQKTKKRYDKNGLAKKVNEER